MMWDITEHYRPSTWKNMRRLIWPLQHEKHFLASVTFLRHIFLATMPFLAFCWWWRCIDDRRFLLFMLVFFLLYFVDGNDTSKIFKELFYWPESSIGTQLFFYKTNFKLCALSANWLRNRLDLFNYFQQNLSTNVYTSSQVRESGSTYGVYLFSILFPLDRNPCPS